MTNLEREWRVGRQLALLTEPGAALPGFMGTGAGVVTMSGQFTGTVMPCRSPVAITSALPCCMTQQGLTDPLFCTWVWSDVHTRFVQQ